MLDLTKQLCIKYSFFGDTIQDSICLSAYMYFRKLVEILDEIEIYRTSIIYAYKNYRYRINKINYDFRFKLYNMILKKKFFYDVRNLIISFIY